MIDTSTNTITGTIAVGNQPSGVVFSPDATRAYVSNINDATLSVIDTGSNTVIATIVLPGGAFPTFLAITPDGKNLYVPDPGSNNILVASTATNSVVATIPVGPSPTAAVITPDGAHAYILREGFVSVIATATNTVSAGPIQVSATQNNFGQIAGLAISPDGAAVYVAGGNNDPVSVISTATNTVVARVDLPIVQGQGEFPSSLAVSPDGSKVYISDARNIVFVLDTATNTIEPFAIPVGQGPTDVAITPDGSLVYVTNFFDGTVSVIATSTNSVVATVQGNFLPVGIAIANLSAPMATLSIENLVINNNLHEQGDFTLGANTGGIDLAHQPLTLTVNNFSLTIPAGSFKQVGGNMHFVFNGTVNGFKVNFNLQAEHGSSSQFDFVFDVHGVSIIGPNPATVGLKIGHNSGTTTAPF
ncbi:MAG: YncE family protein [Candidatus Angelobacter sp.]